VEIPHPKSSDAKEIKSGGGIMYSQAFEELVQKILDSPHLASNDVAGLCVLGGGERDTFTERYGNRQGTGAN
jgi:hypothetical protein